MSSLTPSDAASCRALAVKCGRRANELMARGAMLREILPQLERARELCVMAVKFETQEFEQEEQVSARGFSNAEQAAEVIAPPVTSAVANSGLSQNPGLVATSNSNSLHAPSNPPRSDSRTGFAVPSGPQSIHQNASVGDDI